MSWTVDISAAARKDLMRMPRQDAAAILPALTRLGIDPYTCDVKKLAVSKDLWRLRVGQWRVRFRIDKATRTVYVVRVLPRGSAYRDL